MKEVNCRVVGFQGDVVFARVDKFPEGKILRDKQTAEGALAYGEVTGHAHQIDEEQLAKGFVDLFKITMKEGFILGLDVKAPINITHGRLRGFIGTEADQDYHKPVVLQPGKYVTGIVQEYDPFEQVLRQVRD